MGLDVQANGVASLGGTFLGLTTITLILRFYARFKQGSKVGLDDACMVGAWIGFIGLASCLFYGISKRFIGYTAPKNPTPEVMDELSAELGKTYFAIDSLGIWTVGMTKLSALFFYRRIFCSTGTKNIFHCTTIIFIAVVAAWIVTFFVMTYNLCGHHSINWDVAPGHAKLCKIDYPYLEGATISDFLLEVIVLALPLPKIWSLHATTSRKLAISGVFSFALVGLAASATRMGIYIGIVSEGRSPTRDLFQGNTLLAYFITLEAAFNIIAVNGPTLWYFVSGTSAETVLRSVRSLVSLGSGRGSKTSLPTRKEHGSVSSGSTPLHERKSESDPANKLHGSKELTSDAYPVARPQVSPPPGIQVQYSIEHSEEV